MRISRVYTGARLVVGEEVPLDKSQSHYLMHVLRLKSDAALLLFNGRDAIDYHARLVIDGKTAIARIDAMTVLDNESALRTEIIQGLARADHMDWIIQKTTELGVTRIVPFLSSYTVPRLDRGKGDKRRERWAKIAISAAKQSGRTRIPAILDVQDFDTLVARDWECDAKLFFWEGPSGKRLAAVQAERSALRSVLVVVGPEGGFSAQEESRASSHGFQTVRLGRRILRTETAAMVAVCAVQLLWGDMG